MPAVPTITVADNANGTGCLVQVVGSDGGSLNTVEVTLADRDGWVATSYSRTGDGSIDVGLADHDGSPSGVNLTDAWRVRVNSTLDGSAVSLAHIVCPTRGYEAPHFQAIVAIQMALIEAAIAGLDGKVYRCEHPDPFVAKRPQSLPCVLIHPADAESLEGTGNLSTKWVFPTVVGIVDREWDDGKNAELHSSWRYAAMNLFHRKGLRFKNSPGKVRRLRVSPRAVIEPDGPQKYAFYYSTFVLTAEVDRTISGL